MRLRTAFISTLLLTVLAGCGKEDLGYHLTDNASEDMTLIFYADAYNNLYSDIAANVETIFAGSIPQTGSRKNLLVYIHEPVKAGDYKTPNPSYLMRLRRDELGVPVKDTLLTISKDRSAADPDVLREVVSAAAKAAPSSHYGLILSSHGTGWLPKGYFNTGTISGAPRRAAMADAQQEGDRVFPQTGILTKSFAGEYYFNAMNKLRTKEMDIKDAAAAIPVHMDWILFDACYMGCVEVAYEFRGVTDKIIFSPAEVISTGFDYSKMAEYLLADGQDTEGFAEAYYRMYLNDSRGGDWQSATITVLDCSKIEVLASTCSALFSRYGGILATMEEGDIQRYYRHEKPYFYDLQDILVHAGISGAEASSLQAALDGCIPYKAATPHFLAGEGGFDITAYSGLGMYLPGMGAGELDEYYKGLAWNKATGLVK